MIGTAGPSDTGLYRVEVSGWDQNRAFFVEHSHLEWSETSKVVTLRRDLHNGALLFLRLLQPMSAERSNPVAYEAASLSAMPNGRHKFQLRPISRRANNVGAVSGVRNVSSTK